MNMMKGNINLTALTHVKMEVKGKEGNKVQGIFIPIEINNLYQSEKGTVGFNFSGWEIPKEKRQREDTHIINQYLPKEAKEKLPEGTYPPTLGNATVSTGFDPEPNNSAPEETFTPEDDLPF